MLQITELSFSYPGRTGPLLLERLSLTATPGELLTVLGPNGVGKSSLLKLIAVLLPARTGRICLDDVNLARLRPRAGARARAALA